MRFDDCRHVVPPVGEAFNFAVEVWNISASSALNGDTPYFRRLDRSECNPTAYVGLFSVRLYSLADPYLEVGQSWQSWIICGLCKSLGKLSRT